MSNLRESLSNSPPDFRLLFESSPGLYLALTPDFHIVAVSDAYLRATLTERDQLLGRLIFDAFPDNPDDAGATGVRNLRESLETARDTRRPNTMAVQKYDIPKPAHLGGGFEERYWSPINTPVLDKNGAVVYIIHRVEDVTEFVQLRRTGAELQESTESMRARVEKMDAEVFLRAQEVNEANRRLRAMNEDLAKLYEQFTLLVSQADANLAPAGGGREPGALSPEQTLARLGRLLELHKKMEDELRQSQKLDAVGRLAGGIAHDLNNILTVILGYCEVLLGRFPAGDPVHPQLEEIRIAGQHAAEMTRQLLVFSRRQPFAPAVIDLGTIFREIERIIPRMLGGAIEVASHIDADLFRTKLDPSQLRQVIMNLVVNARDAMPEGGILTLELKNSVIDSRVEPHHGVPDGEYVLLAVTDNGTGMTPELKARVFEPFFTTKEHNRGTGLGLATVYGIVKQSGGHIWLYSEPGAGTSVKVYFPRTNEQTESAPAPQAVKPKGGDETILVLDDNDQIRRLVEGVLQAAGYQVLCASTGEQAERICHDHRGEIDLLVSDVILPGTNGKMVASRLKFYRPALRVLFMSGYTGASLTQREILSVADSRFLEKPFTPDTLLGAVRAALGDRPRGRRVLVLDDARGVREFIANVLTGAGYEVFTAESGRGAAGKVSANSIDIVLTDLSMPDEEGIETVIALRRAYPRLKIVAMSGFFGPDMLDAAKVLGANATLAKPVSAETLRNTIRDVLES